jgi:hypothetical protein
VTDPLSEAREALRRLLVHGRTNDEWLRAEIYLARLDALPAPVRCERNSIVLPPLHCGAWVYPDPPAPEEAS